MDKPQMLSPWAAITLFLLLSVLYDPAEASPVDEQQEDISDMSEVHSCIQGGVINWATQKAAQEYFRVLQIGVKTNRTQNSNSEDSPRFTECTFLEYLVLVYYSPTCAFSRILLSALEIISDCFPEVVFMAIDANPSSSCEYMRPFQSLGFPDLVRPANLSTIGAVQVSSGNSTNGKGFSEKAEKKSVSSQTKIAPLSSFAGKELNLWATCSGADCLPANAINIVSYPTVIFVKKGHKRRFANHNVHKLGDFIRTNMIRNSSESPQVEESSSVRNGLCYADEEDWSKQNRDICPIPDYKHMFVNISELAWLYRTPWINVTKVDLQKTEKNRQCYQARQERIQDVESSMSRVIKPSSSWLEFCSSALDLYIHNPILLISLAYLSLECVMYMFRR